MLITLAPAGRDHRRRDDHQRASSTKNGSGKRDPEMHQTKKGNPWYFGMKAHVGVNSRNKLIHSVEATAANVHDARVLPSLLHGEERRVYGDQAYRGQKNLLAVHAPKAKDFTNQRYRYKGIVDEVEQSKNRTKSKIRARVEHVFAVMKLKFGFTKVCYRGIEKNAAPAECHGSTHQPVHGEKTSARAAGVIRPKGGKPGRFKASEQ